MIEKKLRGKKIEKKEEKEKERKGGNQEEPGRDRQELFSRLKVSY